MIALLALIASQAAPPPPPPDPELAAPVLAFWQEHPITKAERRNLRDVGRARLASELLAQAEEDWSGRPAFHLERLRALMDRLQVLAPYTSPEEDRQVDLCAAGNLFGSLSPQELVNVWTFFRSPAGRRFWSSSRIGEDHLIECYKIGMRGSIDAGGMLRSVAVKPPAAWDGPPVD